MRFLIAVLATYRLAYLAAVDDGPEFVFLKLREWALNRYGDKDWRTKGVYCVLCLSFWFALPVVLLTEPPNKRQLILDWLAVAGGVTLIHKFFR